MNDTVVAVASGVLLSAGVVAVRDALFPAAEGLTVGLFLIGLAALLASASDDD